MTLDIKPSEMRRLSGIPSYAQKKSNHETGFTAALAPAGTPFTMTKSLGFLDLSVCEMKKVETGRVIPDLNSNLFYGPDVCSIIHER